MGNALRPQSCEDREAPVGVLPRSASAEARPYDQPAGNREHYLRLTIRCESLDGCRRGGIGCLAQRREKGLGFAHARKLM
jgi:hypothetical protein